MIMIVHNLFAEILPQSFNQIQIRRVWR